MLKECSDPPLGLYIRGRTPDKELWENRRLVSVVGTRDLSPYGREWCTRLVRAMGSSSEKPSIVSGLALGTDICAHRVALESGLRLNTTAAKSLYTGMVTDSGRFRYDATTSRTYTLASFLLETPFDITGIYRNLYADSYESKKLKAQFVLKIQFTANNVAFIYTTKEELAKIGADIFTVSRGMVNTMADIKGVDIWCNFTETDNGVLCELRSGSHNINPIAVKYGGGGHAKASGATVKDFDTAMKMLADLDALLGE